MASYEVRLTRSAQKELSSLPRPVIGILWERVRSLAEQPRLPQTRKLKGSQMGYRLRVGSYRVIYTTDEQAKLLTVSAIRPRKDAYR